MKRQKQPFIQNSFGPIMLSGMLILSILSPCVYAQSLDESLRQGEAYYLTGEFEKAVEVYEAIIIENPNSAVAFNQLGLAYRALGVDLREVVWYYKAAIEIDPKFDDAYNNLGKAYYGLADFDNALLYCKKALKINPRNMNAAFSIAWVYLLGKSSPTEAVPYFKLVADATKIPKAYFGLGIAYFMNDDRGMVLDMITHLRSIKEETLAIQLEDIIRGHRYIPGKAGAPLVDIDPPPPRAHTGIIPAGDKTDMATDEASTSDVEGVSKIQVRGKMFSLNPGRPSASPQSQSPSREYGDTSTYGVNPPQKVVPPKPSSGTSSSSGY